MKNIKLSIIVPAYNVEAYIGRTMESILSQSFRNFEIVVVNDGSTDNTLAIVSEIAGKDDRIVIVDTPNQGVVAARRAGLLKSKGEYILYVDGDDCLLGDEALEDLTSTMEREKVDLLFFNNHRLDESYQKLKPRSFPLLTSHNPVKSLKELYNGEYWTISSHMHKRALYDKVIDKPEYRGITYGEDCVLLTRLMMVAESVSKIEKAYYGYLLRSDSLSSRVVSLSQKSYEDLYCLSDVLSDILSEYNLRTEFDIELRLVDIRMLMTTFYHGNLDKVEEWSKRAMDTIRKYPEIRKFFPRRYYRLIRGFNYSFITGKIILFYYVTRYNGIK